MKVILNSDVRNLGAAGDVVQVTPGYARNFLFPRKLALVATEDRVRESEHLQKVIEAKKKKATAARKELAQKLKSVTLSFKLQAGENDKLFGSITTADVSAELEKAGFVVDKREIQIPEAIKVLGQHKALVKLGTGTETEIKISVERLG